jgi:hypothetical protein
MLPPGASDGEVNGLLAQATGDHALWADDVRQYSRWAPAPGGYQLVLPSGQAVTGADGKPRVWSTDEVIHHAMTDWARASGGDIGAGTEFGPDSAVWRPAAASKGETARATGRSRARRASPRRRAWRSGRAGQAAR